MRFIYQVRYNTTYEVFDTFLKLETRLANGWKLPQGVRLTVIDQLDRLEPFDLTTQEDVEAWASELQQLASKVREENWDVHSNWDPHAEQKELTASAKQAASAEVLPDANLKTAAAVGKPKTSGIPPVAIMALGAAMQNGVDKYGRFNWRGTGATTTVFYDAMLRHLTQWYEGENFADDSGVHHLAHLMAGAAILLDAELHGVLNDERDRKSFALQVATGQASIYKQQVK